MSDRFCKSYSDPDAEIILKSKDGVLFRVHAYYLKAHSTVFRDMLEIPGLAQGLAEPLAKEPIDVEVRSVALQDFLDAMTKPSTVKIRVLPPYTELFDLCKKFDCDIVGERLARQLAAHANTAPWTCFCIADRYKDQVLARTALLHFGSMTSERKWTHSLTIQTITLELGGEVSLSYLLGLIKVMESKKDRYSLQNVDWDAVSASFVPA